MGAVRTTKIWKSIGASNSSDSAANVCFITGEMTSVPLQVEANRMHFPSNIAIVEASSSLSSGDSFSTKYFAVDFKLMVGKPIESCRLMSLPEIVKHLPLFIFATMGSANLWRWDKFQRYSFFSCSTMPGTVADGNGSTVRHWCFNIKPMVCWWLWLGVSYCNYF